MVKKRILFVCRFNQTRSQMARELFEKLNKNKNIEADSVGIIRAWGSKDLKKSQDYVFKKYGLKKKKSKQLDTRLVSKQDIIIIVADDVPTSVFNPQKNEGTRVIKWRIKDDHKYKDKTRRERLEKVYLDIEKRIKKLVSSLNENK